MMGSHQWHTSLEYMDDGNKVRVKNCRIRFSSQNGVSLTDNGGFNFHQLQAFFDNDYHVSNPGVVQNGL